MGSAVGHVLTLDGTRVVATLAGRSERTGELARKAGLELLPSLAEVVRESDVVLSIAPPGEAEAIVRDLADVARSTGARPLVADLNAVAPDTVRRMASALAGTLDLVDGAISGPPPWKPGTTRIYLSGGRAAELVTLGFLGVELVLVGTDVGTASAVKMCTASVYKGSLALLTHALLTAHEHGVVDHVLDDLGSSFPQLVEQPARGMARAATVSGRYVPEMREIAATQGAAGLPTALFEAMAEVYEALSSRPLARLAPEELDSDLSLDDALDALSPRP
jgi:3-hydroxyisobutyrate dehydrogenase-like beta-hydroxyacid dehydrogenase